MTDTQIALRWLEYTALLTLFGIAFFLAFPNADIITARAFGDLAHGFTAASWVSMRAIRATMIALTDGVAVIALALLALNIAVPRFQVIRSRVLAFVGVTYLSGPGLIVNGLIKTFSERARPRNLVEFGGDALYARPFELSGQCGGHCSFVSGEASALATMATMLLLVFVPQLPIALRRPAATAIVATAISGSALRVVFGAHFPSDVIFGGLFMTAFTICLYLAFGLHRLGCPFVRADQLAAPVRVLMVDRA